MNQELLTEILRWDIESWRPAIELWEHEVDWSRVHRGLELGAAEGGFSLWLALKGKQVVCSDYVPNQRAPAHHGQHNVGALIQYEVIDGTKIPYENHFDVVIFKSMLGAIGHHDQIQLQDLTFQQIHKALKVGGKLLFAENLVGTRLHAFARSRFVPWGQDWRYVSLAEMRGFLGRFSRYDLRATGVLGCFGRSERQRNLLAGVDRAVLNRWCRDDWKYIAYGIAEK